MFASLLDCVPSNFGKWILPLHWQIVTHLMCPKFCAKLCIICRYFVLLKSTCVWRKCSSTQRPPTICWAWERYRQHVIHRSWIICFVLFCFVLFCFIGLISASRNCSIEIILLFNQLGCLTTLHTHLNPLWQYVHLSSLHTQLNYVILKQFLLNSSLFLVLHSTHSKPDTLIGH